LFFLGQFIIPPIFRNTVSLKLPGIVESVNFLLRILISLPLLEMSPKVLNLGKYAKTISEHMDYKRNPLHSYLLLHKIVSDCAKSILPYSPYTPIDINLSLSRQLFLKYTAIEILDHLFMKGGMV
jgi:hypothetical protein